MKQKFLSLAVLLLAVVMVFGLSSISFANAVTDGGPGGALLFTYYDVRGVSDGGLNVTDNYFVVTNTSTHWVQSHVRVRTGDCSVELLDFDIWQSPKDNFTFDLYESGGVTFASCDTNTLEDSGFTLNFDADGNGTDDCFVLDSDTFPAMLSLITKCGDCETGATINNTQATELVKKGYVEVIMEASLEPSTSNKNECDNENPSDDPGDSDYLDISDFHNIRDIFMFGAEGGDPDCEEDIWYPWPALQGRQYYVEVDTGVSPVTVMRLAQLNAFVVSDGWYTDPIIHENSYDDELASDYTGDTSCNASDGGEWCFAYAEAETTDNTITDPVAAGANDMNQCFYTDDIGGDLVINKFGAGATFGPTLADLYSASSDRNGDLHETDDALEYVCQQLSAMTQTETDSGAYWAGYKQYVDSHYFQAPSPGPYDMTTAYAFTFPCMHFIGEDATITAEAIYDNAENEETIDIGKFISPGLPTDAIPAEEAALFSLSAPYNEGWIRFAVEASNDTADCVDQDSERACDVDLCNWDNSNCSETDYVPAYIGAVFTTGAENLGASPFNYNNVWYNPPCPGCSPPYGG